MLVKFIFLCIRIENIIKDSLHNIIIHRTKKKVLDSQDFFNNLFNFKFWHNFKKTQKIVF